MKRPEKVLGRISSAAVLTLSCVVGLGARAQDPAVLQENAKAPAEAPQKTETLAPGVYARVNGQDVTERAYAEYLLSSLGKSRLSEFIDRLLITEQAKAEGLVIAQDEVETLVEERIDRTIKGVYRGNRESFLEGLERQGTTLDDRKSQLRQRIYYNVLLEKLILKARTVTEEAVQQEFERLYGPGGVRHKIRHILVSTGKRIGRTGEALPGRAEAEAAELAGKVHKELLAGGDFVQLVKRYSDDTFTVRNDGVIPLYREGFYGAAFHKAVEQLTEASPLSGVVRSPKGFHLIQLIEKQVSKLEEVREEIEKEVRESVPTSRERHELIKKLRDAAKIVR